MGVHEHLTVYDGRAVVDFDPELGELCATGPELVRELDLAWPVPPEPAWRVRTYYDGPAFDEVFAEFLDAVDAARVTHLVIGFYGSRGDSFADPVELLVDAAGRLPRLRALFLGDIVSEEHEISWIPQSDITPLFAAFPGLGRLDVRGGRGLALRPVSHESLRMLRLESGGLPREIVRAVHESDLPSLDHLDLWLGSPAYGGDARIEDLRPILDGARLPALRHLGLEDSEIQDEIAQAVAGAPIVARLESLSLGLGLLTDTGAEALLSGQPLTHLELLDLRHHYLSDAMMDRLEDALPDTEVDLDRARDPEDEWRMIAAAE
ncbi:STM4015 family protein [Spirillospora sp. NPDC029432]|uniref:STM4015 family protein n=1 Tax=Spirillospora sp. NPDC029432 TaxID=3154599 RepID=UPI003454BDA6